MTDVLDVDLLAFERGTRSQRRAAVDGVMRSLGTGFVFTSHDLGVDLLDTAYAMLAQFFALPAERKARWHDPDSHGQTGYTGLLVETAATSDVADWKEMLNWGDQVPRHHPLRARYPHRYLDRVLPEADVPGITTVLVEFHTRVLEVQARFLRVIAEGVGVGEHYFDDVLRDGSHLTRAIHYPSMRDAPSAAHVWADAHADINLITALPRATGRGLQLESGDGWVDVVPPTNHMVVNSGIMLERLTNGQIRAGRHRVIAAPDEPGDRYSVVQFCHPAPWFQLAPLEACIDAEHPLQFGTIEAGALLELVLYEIGLITPPAGA
ncbi:MAG TPA: 2-oxoglutarate and iron-dependent oxygenase domain-containing protein [Acidimicrobiales bacterium]|jgi:isopenicillin N synthase-like dioxygenase|nr:2-oxoglutarate and iron-dependent oxygenase domain-containing protein [Acidimicrobiales bacterium]